MQKYGWLTFCFMNLFFLGLDVSNAKEATCWDFTDALIPLKITNSDANILCGGNSSNAPGYCIYDLKNFIGIRFRRNEVVDFCKDAISPKQVSCYLYLDKSRFQGVTFTFEDAFIACRKAKSIDPAVCFLNGIHHLPPNLTAEDIAYRCQEKQ